MTTHTANENPLLPVQPAPNGVDPELAPLLTEPFAKAWEAPVAMGAAGLQLPQRLMDRLAASRQAEHAMITARRRRVARDLVGAGVTAQMLYAAPAGRALRPGEPLRVRLLELAPGAIAGVGAIGGGELTARHRECLVISGSVVVDGQTLSRRDYQVTPAGIPQPNWQSPGGALLLLRESDHRAEVGDRSFAVLDAQAGWAAFGPGIQRRVLWQRGGEASVLYHAQPGAQVPKHAHVHDEECLMVQGELFLDDVLLQPGDYQLAPSGTGHRITETDTGVVVYAHGDLDFNFIA